MQPLARTSETRTVTAAYCRECLNARYRENYKKRDKELGRLYGIKHRYGLDADTYKAMIAEGCAVCGSKEKLVIDHDHACCPGIKTCGQCIRGVLCDDHNKSEGHLRTWDSAFALSTYMARDVNILDVLEQDAIAQSNYRRETITQ